MPSEDGNPISPEGMQGIIRYSPEGALETHLKI